MTVGQVLAFCDSVKINACTKAQKLYWLTRCETDIALNVFLLDLVEAEKFIYKDGDEDVELLVGVPYDDLYGLYLIAQIDLANGEYDRYQNSMEVYNARMREFICWFARHYNPANPWKNCCCANDSSAGSAEDSETDSEEEDETA